MPRGLPDLRRGLASCTAALFGLTLIGCGTMPQVAAPADETEARMQRLVDEGQAALARGDARGAFRLFEQASSAGEHLEAEVGMVRAALQSGDMRQAMAWGNLVAGEHPESMEAQGLLSLLEDRIGHTEHALARLRNARTEHPDDPAPVGSMADILIDRHAPATAVALIDEWTGAHAPATDLERLRTRAAIAMNEGSTAARAATTAATGPWPAPTFQAIPAVESAQLAAGNGVVVDEGRRVLTHRRVVALARNGIWVRNGLGQVEAAELEPAAADAGDIAILHLRKPWPAAWGLAPGRVASPDSARFLFVFGFPVARSLAPSYPAMTPGLMFRAKAGPAPLMQVTCAFGTDDSGAPIFDSRGRLLGLAIGAGDAITVAGAQAIGATDRQAQLGAGNFAIRGDALPLPRPGPAIAAPELSVEALYTLLAPSVVQVIAPP